MKCKYRNSLKGLYIVASIFFLLLLNYSAWLAGSCLAKHTSLLVHLCSCKQITGQFLVAGSVQESQQGKHCQGGGLAENTRPGFHVRLVPLHDGLRAQPQGARERGAPEGEAGALVSDLQQVQVLQEVQPNSAHKVRN